MSTFFEGLLGAEAYLRDQAVDFAAVAELDLVLEQEREDPYLTTCIFSEATNEPASSRYRYVPLATPPASHTMR